MTFHKPNFQSNEIAVSFQPFVRHQGTWNLPEILKTAILTITLLPIRLCVIGFAILIVYVAAFIANTNTINLTYPLPRWKMWLYRIPSICSVVVLWAFGINLNIQNITYKEMKERYGYKNSEWDTNKKCHLVASNHIGFVDILALIYLFNTGFVAKEAIKNVVIFGKLSSFFGSLFLQKGNSLTQQLKDRIHLLCNHTCDGNKCVLCIYDKISIFPEGTTTNGQSMLTFRTGLFYAASKYPIIPVAIYSENKNFSVSYESITFTYLVYRLLTQFRNDLKVVIGKPYVPSPEEIDDPNLYAKNFNILISKMLGNQPIFMLNRKHKIEIYHKYLKLKMENKPISEEKIADFKQKAVDISTGDETLKYYQRNNKL